MQPRPDRLDVYDGSDLVGAVHDSAWRDTWQRWREERPGLTIAALSGNHDHALDGVEDCGHFPARLCREISHLAADGRRYLVLHGDQCDARMVEHRFLNQLQCHQCGAVRAGIQHPHDPAGRRRAGYAGWRNRPRLAGGRRGR